MPIVIRLSVIQFSAAMPSVVAPFFVYTMQKKVFFFVVKVKIKEYKSAFITDQFVDINNRTKLHP
jgi:hypothetical protein